MSQSQDMAAILNLFQRTMAKNPTAANLKASFLSWYGGLNIIERNLSDWTLTEAQNRRDNFNRANAGTPGVVPASGSSTAPVVNVIPPGPMPTIKKATRSTNDKAAVRVWQRFLGLVADGDFWTKTDTATRAWQRTHKGIDGKALVVDGEVGGKTWSAAQAISGAVMNTATNVGTAVQQAVAAVSTPKPPVTPQSVANVAKAAASKTPAKAAPKPAPKVVIAPKPPASVKTAAAQAAKSANAKLGPPVVTAGTFAPEVAMIRAHATEFVNEFSLAPTWLKVGVGGLAALSAFLGLKAISKAA